LGGGKKTPKRGRPKRKGKGLFGEKERSLGGWRKQKRRRIKGSSLEEKKRISQGSDERGEGDVKDKKKRGGKKMRLISDKGGRKRVTNTLKQTGHWERRKGNRSYGNEYQGGRRVFQGEAPRVKRSDRGDHSMFTESLSGGKGRARIE